TADMSLKIRRTPSSTRSPRQALSLDRRQTPGARAVQRGASDSSADGMKTPLSSSQQIGRLVVKSPRLPADSYLGRTKWLRIIRAQQAADMKQRSRNSTLKYSSLAMLR